MSDMVEKVARALALADLDEETRQIVNLDAHMEHVAEHYEDLASAAIEAMREPSDGVMRIVREKHGFQDASIYSKFIDAALKGEAE